MIKLSLKENFSTKILNLIKICLLNWKILFRILLIVPGIDCFSAFARVWLNNKLRLASKKEHGSKTFLRACAKLHIASLHCLEVLTFLRFNHNSNAWIKITRKIFTSINHRKNNPMPGNRNNRLHSRIGSCGTGKGWWRAKQNDFCNWLTDLNIVQAFFASAQELTIIWILSLLHGQNSQHKGLIPADAECEIITIIPSDRTKSF